ncbi:hypothetical protein GCM10007147_04300 [Nocardiopsis kunsanensis]|uniref:Uncharacterized protein n=1 Tax=Nocardiopsis kunsanensis TaxID=141693 RepID=A0A919CET7_9ACTN|nr:hypothetical protein GCM10007147_04300 [Nocardiopsis kunsanensis]
MLVPQVRADAAREPLARPAGADTLGAAGEPEESGPGQVVHEHRERARPRRCTLRVGGWGVKARCACRAQTNVRALRIPGLAPEVPEGGAVLTRVKITVQVELIPGAEQASALSATLGAVNGAANRVSQVAFERGVPRDPGRGLVLEGLQGLRSRVRPARRPPPPSNDGLRPGSLSDAPAGRAPFLGLRPARRLPRLQGPAGGCARGFR